MVDELALDTIEQVESEICRLPHVQVARIVTDGPRVTEVHIVASPGKSAKQIVRDVQSVALATFGLELDHRVVSVVQLGTNGDGGTTAIDFEHGHIDLTRPSLDEVTIERTGLRASARVRLQVDGREVVGVAQGTVATAARHRLVAQATVDALRQLEAGAEAVDVENAQVVRIGGQDVAVVAAVFVAPPAEYTVSGSAVVRDGHEGDAVARATLDATNRRLARFTHRG
jgi:hypothetical protein